VTSTSEQNRPKCGSSKRICTRRQKNHNPNAAKMLAISLLSFQRGSKNNLNMYCLVAKVVTHLVAEQKKKDRFN
jgi:hypothetical protein